MRSIVVHGMVAIMKQMVDSLSMDKTKKRGWLMRSIVVHGVVATMRKGATKEMKKKMALKVLSTLLLSVAYQLPNCRIICLDQRKEGFEKESVFVENDDSFSTHESTSRPEPEMESTRLTSRTNSRCSLTDQLTDGPKDGQSDGHIRGGRASPKIEK